MGDKGECHVKGQRDTPVFADLLESDLDGFTVLTGDFQPAVKFHGDSNRSGSECGIVDLRWGLLMP